jgi:type 1 glutamine amidotransferase
MWLHHNDELYANLREPGKHMTILGTTHSNTENVGTGYDEPQLMALSYGKGMIFHNSAGHDVVGMSSIDFGVRLLRGIEWAASGRSLKKYLPTATTVNYRADIAAMTLATPKSVRRDNL